MNPTVSQFLDDNNHPLRTLIDYLRKIILNSLTEVDENIKWNAPNYTVNGRDVLTMKIFPPKQIQLVFHQGATIKANDKNPIMQDPYGILTWKDGNRAIISFKDLNDLMACEKQLTLLIQAWVKVAIV